MFICTLTWWGNEQPRHTTGQIARPVNTPSTPHSDSLGTDRIGQHPDHNPKVQREKLRTEGTHRGEGIEGNEM